ncbi:hypothetical protein M9Y10_037219 [Tritrichomonas musculus]|uniref:Recombinase family protein n=1 Tax=Tritrichomonas musculus TaxID=1915356 RepID=A0ABR2GK43_9EUKA
MQVRYYTNYIYSNAGWDFVKVYTDEGISAVNTKNRDGFKEMIEDAMNGKIDLIITKSVSRFARNTVDTLTTVRNLKEKGIEVYFEKENIYSLDSKGELLLTIMSSLAQEESRSISENVTWGYRKRFAEGRVLIPYGNFMGYEKGEDGLPKIVPEEAKTIRLIYKLFLDGKTSCGIGKILKERGILSPMGKKNWSDTTIMSILTNEKYKGEAILQKSFVVDYLTKKTKRNEGEVPMYHVKNSHEAIIDPEVFDLVQAEIEKRKKLKGSHSGNSVFSSKIVCGECGEFYGPRTFHSNSKYRRVVWQCKTKLKKEIKCEAPLLYKESIEKMFIDSFNELLKNKDEIVENSREFIKSIDDTEVLEKEKARLCGESRLLYNKIQSYIDKNATETLDQNTYEEHYNTLSNQYEELKHKIEKIDTKIKIKKAGVLSIENFLNEITARENLIDTFDEKLFTSVVDKIVVKSYTKAAIVFKNGQELSLNLTDYN